MTAAATQTPASIGRETALSLMRDMILCRCFEEKCAEEYSAGRIRGFLHLYIGEEAVAVGAMRALSEGDVVFATYRDHAHALLRGVPAGAIMAEMFGKREGCSHGRGGSMHLFSRDHHFFGGNAIVAGALPLAVGYALATKLKNRHDVTACFFGEGAIAEGEFHESLNLAALWQLPALFVCENNLYAMGTALDRSESQIDLCAKAGSYRIKTKCVDGMDVLAVLHAATEAVQHIRETGSPVFIECQTYRFRAHSMFDPDLYRDPEEVKRWKLRDTIPGFFSQAVAAGMLISSDLEMLEKEVELIVQEAVAFAERGTFEPVEDLLRHVYSETEMLQSSDGVK